MGIRNDRGFSENVSHDQIRALPADTRQRKELLESSRNFSSVLIPEHPHTGGDVSGLAFSESAGTDDLFNILGLAGCQGIDIRILFIELLHNDVHTGVRALRGKTDADEQLPGLIILERAVGIRVFIFQSLDHGECKILFIHKGTCPF